MTKLYPFNRTLFSSFFRIEEVEKSLLIRSSWGTNEKGERVFLGFKSAVRAESAKEKQRKPSTASAATQYEPESEKPGTKTEKEERESVKSNTSSVKKADSKRKKKESLPISQVNITFPSDKFEKEKLIKRSSSANLSKINNRRRSPTARRSELNQEVNPHQLIMERFYATFGKS